jgi:hypothetical protein
MVIYRFLLNIWCNLLKFKNGNFKTISYGAMIYNFIQRKESIFTYVYLGFLVYPPKSFRTISLKSQPGEFQ